MGVYSVKCPGCNSSHMWFSGSLDQRCQSCINGKDKESNMDREQMLYDALHKTIGVQNELIAFLKSEIERLKLSQLYIAPYKDPNIFPPTNPSFWPLTTPTPPFTITSVGGLPPGSVQSGGTTSITNIDNQAYIYDSSLVKRALEEYEKNSQNK